MAQISIINIKNIIQAKRFDAEYFKPEYLKDDFYLENKGFFLLYEISNVKGGKRLPLGEKFSEKGVPYIRAEDIKNDFVEYENVPRISLQLHEKLKKYQTKKDDILLTIVGSVGAIGIVNFNLERCNLTENAAKITNLDFNKYKSEVIFSFLLSKYGQNQIKREKVGTVQEKLSLDRLRKFKIPLLPQSFQLQIEKIVKEAYEKQSLSKELYKEAEQILLKELDLKDFKPKHKLTFTTTKKEIEQDKRFDAEYFQPKYEEIIEKIKSYKGGFDKVGEVVNIKDKNFTSKDYVKYKYVALADISNDGYIQSFEEDFGKNLPTRARRLINKGDVIISSIEGSLNSCALIEEEFDNSICSTGFYVVNSERINPETLLVLMKLYPIQKLLKKGCKGTILTAIPKDELEKIVLPIIDNQTQQKISQKIQESFKLKKELKELLEKAKKMVEEEIEK